MFERTPGVQKTIVHYWSELQNKNVIYLTNEESELLNSPWMAGYFAHATYFIVQPNKISLISDLQKEHYIAFRIWKFQVACIRRLLKLNKVFVNAIKELSVLPEDGIWGDEETHTLQEWENLDNARDIIMMAINYNNMRSVVKLHARILKLEKMN